ncbi:TylF/MycF/NovP-related O-methyltransferase [Streptomyces sp. VTCC 41912]|uniref:TylF/MycF/NovP-related O-methyltransferase n=1 Tax=Streptomyces sp. VTCC 41912 TaxID=3383243 RepID=UPI003896DBE5
MTDVRGALREALLGEQPRTVDRGRMPVVERELARVVATGVPGAVVEFGCFRGGMTAWMRAVLEVQGSSDRVIHTYNALQGRPATAAHDGDHPETEASTARTADVRGLHDTWGLPQPVIHEGGFHRTLPDDLPERIAFGYVDADRYASTLACLRACVPRLSPGAVLVIDDYADASCPARPTSPGVLRACEEFFGAPTPVAVAATDAGWALGVYRHLDRTAPFH